MLGAPTRTHSSLWKALPVLSITFGVLIGLAAQAQQNSVEERVNMILGHMTLEEKLAYVSGVGFPNPSPSPIGIFNIKPIERLKLPEIYGVDGQSVLLVKARRRVPVTRRDSSLLPLGTASAHLTRVWPKARKGELAASTAFWARR